MSVISVAVEGHEISIVDQERLASGSVGVDSVQFEFDDAWDGLTKFALFWGGGSDDPYAVSVDSDGLATIPWEVIGTKGTVKLGVFGVESGETTPRITSGIVQFKVPTGAWSDSIENSGDPTPTIVEEFVAAAQQAITDLQSALQEALDSGDFDGPKGDKGDPGVDGVTPAFSVGTVTTLPAGSSATATITGTTAAPVLNLGIPKGDPDDSWQEDVGELKSATTDLEQYVRDLSPVVTAGPSPVVSVSDAAPLDAEHVVISIAPVQSGSGDPSPDNVRPISGWTGANVSRTGKNLLNRDIAYYYNDNLYFGRRSQGNIPDGTFILNAGTYTISSSSNMTAIYTFDESGTSMGLVYNNTKITITNPKKQAVLIRFYKSGTLEADFNSIEVQIELGSTATAYEPYRGNAYSVTFPAAAGTIYGGTLDLTAGTLTVDRVGIAVSSATGQLGKNGQTSVTTRAFFTPSIAKLPGVSGFISNRFANVAQNDVVGKMVGRVATGGIEFYLPATVPNTDAGVQNWFAENATQLVYELATPTVYTLNPVTLTLLRGNNALWADCGDTTLTYRQDVATLLSALTAPDETDMTANANYAVNSFFTVGGTLYKAAAAIATGETIVPGSNCTATTIADQLTYLYSQI